MTAPVTRLRISTAILLVALLGFPFGVFGLPVPHVFVDGSKAAELLNWYLYDFSSVLLVAAFFAAFVTAVALAVQRRWSSILQPGLEMVISIVCFFFLPAY
ncbi:hypothetical protein BH11PSE11_BH11PSE11_22520 [soil metagenome]